MDCGTLSASGACSGNSFYLRCHRIEFLLQPVPMEYLYGKGLGRAEQLCQNVSGPELLDGPDQQFIFCRHIGGVPGGLRAGPGRGIGTEMAEKSGGILPDHFFHSFSDLHIGGISDVAAHAESQHGVCEPLFKGGGSGNPGH